MMVLSMSDKAWVASWCMSTTGAQTMRTGNPDLDFGIDGDMAGVPADKQGVSVGELSDIIRRVIPEVVQNAGNDVDLDHVVAVANSLAAEERVVQREDGTIKIGTNPAHVRLDEPAATTHRFAVPDSASAELEKQNIASAQFKHGDMRGIKRSGGHADIGGESSSAKRQKLSTNE